MANVLGIDVTQYRTPDHDVLGVFTRRWSPRAMSGEAVGQDQLLRMFEAARWAPSSYNEQPWRFLYAHRDTPHWKTFFGLLGAPNQVWCEKAGVLVVIVTRTKFTHNGTPNRVAVFDAGSSWENMALQGVSMNLVVHGMAGFDYDRARTELSIPAEFEPCAMVAIGKPGLVSDLPEKLRAAETPSSRRPITESIFEGPFRS